MASLAATSRCRARAWRSLHTLGRLARVHAIRSACAARYGSHPPCRPISRLTVEGDLRFVLQFDASTRWPPNLVRSPPVLSALTREETVSAHEGQIHRSSAKQHALCYVEYRAPSRSYLQAPPSSIFATAQSSTPPKSPSISGFSCRTTFPIMMVLHRPIESTPIRTAPTHD